MRDVFHQILFEVDDLPLRVRGPPRVVHFVVLVSYIVLADEPAPSTFEHICTDAGSFS